MKNLSPDETSYFCEQLSLMLGAGMQLADGLEILSSDIGSKRLKTVCEALAQEMRDEKSLSDAMQSLGCFPDYAVNMVKIGSVTGRLETVLADLSEFYDNRAELNRTIRSAVLHPLMLLLMMTAVIIVLIVMVIPMFGEIFSQFDASVSETVKNAIDTAYTVGTVLLAVLLAIIVIVFSTVLLSRIPSVKHALSDFASKFPLTRRISKKFSLAKISDAMSIMASAGISPDEMPEYAATLIEDKTLRGKLLNCRERVLEGEFFADVISSAGIFPAMHEKSLKIAYNSGSFEQAWKKLAERCNTSAADSASGITSVIEPLIVIILTAVIGAVLLTVMVPLMNIMSVLG